MLAILTALEEQHSELAALLDGLDDAGWQRPTRCEGWTVADVVLHLAQTDELALRERTGRVRRGARRARRRRRAARQRRRRSGRDRGARTWVTERRAARTLANRRGRAARGARGERPTSTRRVGHRSAVNADVGDDTARRVLDPHRRRRRGVGRGAGTDRSPGAHRTSRVAHVAVRVRATTAGSSRVRSPSTCGGRADSGGTSALTRSQRQPSRAPAPTCVSWLRGVSLRRTHRSVAIGPDARAVLELVRTYA